MYKRLWQLSDRIFFVDAKPQTAKRMELNDLSPCEKMHLEHHDERPRKTRVGSHRESSAGERAGQSEGIRCGFNPAHFDPSSHAYGTRTNSFSRRPYFRDREASATCREMKLEKALEPYHPVLRGAPSGLPFRFDAKTIANGLNFTLSTDLGDLDFLGEVSGVGSFPEVLAASDTKDVGGVDCKVLSLDGLIKAKTAAGRPRDLYVLPELRALNELKRKTGLS